MGREHLHPLRRTKDLIAQRKLVAPFKKGVASPRGYYVFQSDASRRKPEVGEFLAWLATECGQAARTAARRVR
jgi:ABC-type molybdate transport system substrate-binding protein